MLAAAGVFVGARGAGVVWSPAVLAAAGAAIWLSVVANAFNDYDDLAIDAIIHPDRPLPSGAITPSAALRAVALGAVGGVAFSIAARPALGLVSIGVIGAMLGYGRVKTSWGIAANAMVAVLGSMPFLYGAWAAGRPQAGLVLMGVAAPLHFAREIAKDIDDIDGDRGRRSTLPLTTSVWFAHAVSGVAAIAFIPLWTILMHFRLIAIPAIVLVAIAAWWRSQALYKAAMAVAMIAYYVSPP